MRPGRSCTAAPNIATPDIAIAVCSRPLGIGADRAALGVKLAAKDIVIKANVIDRRIRAAAIADAAHDTVVAAIHEVVVHHDVMRIAKVAVDGDGRARAATIDTNVIAPEDDAGGVRAIATDAGFVTT